VSDASPYQADQANGGGVDGDAPEEASLDATVDAGLDARREPDASGHEASEQDAAGYDAAGHDATHDGPAAVDAALDSPRDVMNDSQPPTDAPVRTGPGVPQLVQHVSASSTRVGDFLFGPPWRYYTALADPSTAGNAIVVAITYNGSANVAVSDDKSNPYSIAVQRSAQGRSIAIAGAFNVAAGTRVVTLDFSADPLVNGSTNTQPALTEWANIVGFGGAGAADGHGTVASPGTVTGDLSYQVVASLGFAQSSFAGNSLLSADLVDGFAVDSSTSTTPTITLGTADAWVSAAVGLKSGQTGSVPGGIRIVHLQHQALPVNAFAGGNGSFQNPTHLQFPCSGAVPTAMVAGGVQTVLSITDTQGNAWKSVAPYQTQFDSSAQAWAAPGSSCSTSLGMVVSWDGNRSDQTLMLYDAVGVTAVDKAVGGTGDQAPPGNVPASLDLGFTLTPTATPELVIAAAAWDNNTAAGIAGLWLDTNRVSHENCDGYPIDENNGWAHGVTTSSGPTGFVWTGLCSPENFSNWSGVALSLK
jgi:hypothetical protein